MKWEVVWLSLFSLFVTQFFDIQAQKSTNPYFRICSTWGRAHFKTFDGDFYEFPGACEYNFVSDCKTDFKEFSVHTKRTNSSGNPTISYVVVTVNNLAFRLSKSQITVNDKPVTTPYLKAGVKVENNADNIKLHSTVGITVILNGEDAVMYFVTQMNGVVGGTDGAEWQPRFLHQCVKVEIDDDYSGRTCGLCGNFDGVPANDFTLNDRKMNPTEFGNKQKVRLPNDLCEDLFEGDEAESSTSRPTCETIKTVCDELRSDTWASCYSVVPAGPFYLACAQDVCSCEDNPNDLCFCSSLSEYSRICSHAGGSPPSWRSADFCEKKCPYNMVYIESGSPCLDTCTNEDTTTLCEEHNMNGCFCPSGTVFDDISKKGCIPQTECQCKHDKIYESGEVYKQDREECTCLKGSWECKSLDTPETCAIEDGSHVTTFDGKTFGFHGNCYYTLAKVASNSQGISNFTIRAQMMPCSNQELDTCLKTVKILLNNNGDNVIKFNSDGTVDHISEITLPYRSGDISIFKASSFHILLQTTYGLQVQVQIVPTMQVYIKMDQKYTGKTRGLCGNYNRIMFDDIKTRQGIVDGTPTTFIDSWKSNGFCSNSQERLDDPCSFSTENEQYAKYWCALLRSKNSTFSSCHALVDSDPYYKRCIFSTCNCEKSEACLCSVFSSYARACASKGVVLPDWNENVCEKYIKNCPASKAFYFRQKRCQFTCGSLSSKEKTCLSDFSPVDGCNCAEGSYLDDEDTCVPESKCPCNSDDVNVKAGKSITIKDERCVCVKGVLRCQSLTPTPTTCVVPKVFFNCSSTEPEQQCTRTCSNPDNEDCDSTECESGCRCPEGLLEDGKGSCVKEGDCPCRYNSLMYANGVQIPKDCNTCTCKSGNWNCTEKQCPATCIIYGSGHYTTFDQKTYTFQGNCAYTAVKNKCGNKTQAVNFGVITENVPCGSTGTTCSKSLRVRLGRNEIKLFKGKYQEQDVGSGAEVNYKIRRVGLYLLIESSVGLAVVWDRKTTVRILVEPSHMGKVCGLCGNYDGDGQNDFTTQRLLVVSSPLDFGNSWKTSSTCPDTENVDDPCEAAPNRHQWSKMMCSIITGNTFKDCQKAVDPRPFYENCLKDSCACDGGGDCECFCAAVATYAQACSEAGVCVSWRTPEICPIFCDYYNHPEGCEWHYSPCHTPCLKTCSNPTGICLNPLPKLEGCFPVCPEDKPFLDERNHTCVKYCAPSVARSTEVPLTTAFTTLPQLPRTEAVNKTTPTTTTLSTTLPPGVTPSNKTTTSVVPQTIPGSTVPATGSTSTIVTPMTTSPLVQTTPSNITTPSIVPQTTLSNKTTPSVVPQTTPSNKTTPSVVPQTTPSNKTTPSVVPQTTPGSTLVPTESKATTPLTTSTTLPPGVTPTNQTTTSVRTPSTKSTTTEILTTTANITKPPPESTTAQVPATIPNVTTPTTSTTTSIPPEHCPKFSALINETFHFCNCTMARCSGNDTLEIIPYECPPIAEIACTNEKKPILEWDEFHCCQHPVCECFCEGWGDSHYNTFDGSYYSYEGNCTYVLMEEITPKFNLKIYVEGGSCDPNEASCPRSLIVMYGSLAITLSGAPKLEAQANKTALKLPFSQGGIKIINSGINLILEIPRIEVVIKYAKSGFGLFVPVKTFGRNTRGHCGTCNNIQSDDCMLPGGQLVKSCAEMADNWLVPNSDKNSKQDCKKPLGPPTILEPTTKPVIQGSTGPQRASNVSQTTIIGSSSTTITRSTLQPPGTETTAETPTTITGSPQTGAQSVTETTITSATTTGVPGITETETSLTKPSGALGTTTTGFKGQPTGGRFSTQPRIPGITKTSPQVSETPSSVGSASTIFTGSSLPPPGTDTTVATPSTATGSTSPPIGAQGATEITLSSATTSGVPGITEIPISLTKSSGTAGITPTSFIAQPTGEGSSTQPSLPGISETSPQVSETSSSIGSASTISTGSSLPPPGTETTVATPSTATGSTLPPNGAQGATETTISSATTSGVPGITETQTSLTKSSGGVGITTTSFIAQPTGVRSSTQPRLPGISETSPQVSESSSSIGSASTIITGSTLPPPGTKTTLATPSTATSSTLTPNEATAAPGTESAILQTTQTVLPVKTETTTEKYTGPSTTSATGVEKPTSKTISTEPPPGATSGPKATELFSTGNTSPEVPITTPPKGSTQTQVTLSTILVKGTGTTPPGFTETEIPSGVSLTTPTESTSAGGKPTTSTSQTTLPPGVTPTTQPTASGETVITGSTTQQVVPKVSKTTPTGFKATTIKKSTLLPRGTETPSIGVPGAIETSEGTTETPSIELSPGTTEILPTAPSSVTVNTGSTTEQPAPEGSLATLETRSTVTTISLSTFPLGTETTTVKPPSTTKSTLGSTQPVETTTEPIPCQKDSVCGLLTSTDGPFAECHDSVTPRKFHSSCVSDSCNKVDPAVECKSLESYAAACAQVGVCIDWRNYTKLCVSDCPSDKVYKACGPAEQPTCEDHPDEPPINITIEGCFCPGDTKLFNKDSEVCVKTCGCLDPENKPREFDEAFEYNCQDCTCQKSKTVTCKPKDCPKPENTTCNHPGYVLVNETSSLEPCCVESICLCQISKCPVPNMNCSVGFKPVLNVPEGICCPSYLCVPKKVCVHAEVEYENGYSVPGKECEECMCTNETSSFSAGLFEIICTVPACNTTCEEGLGYVEKKSDKCCGKCEPTHCVVTENGTKKFLIEGESYSPPTNKCEVHACVKTEDTLVTLTSTVPCAHFNESECLPNTIQTLANGCCKTCEEKEKACKKVSSKTQITSKGCTSKEEVDMPSCEGSCNTFSKYSQAADSMEHSCSCCKELRSSNRTVDLLCSDGKTVPHTYMYVEDCGCNPTECSKAEAAPSRRRRSFTLV